MYNYNQLSLPLRRTRRVYNTLRAQTRIRIDASLDTDKSLFELTFTTRRTVDRTGGMYAKIHFKRRFQEERITERVIRLVNAILIENQTIVFFLSNTCTTFIFTIFS